MGVTSWRVCIDEEIAGSKILTVLASLFYSSLALTLTLSAFSDPKHELLDEGDMVIHAGIGTSEGSMSFQ